MRAVCGQQVCLYERALLAAKAPEIERIIKSVALSDALRFGAVAYLYVQADVMQSSPNSMDEDCNVGVAIACSRAQGGSARSYATTTIAKSLMMIIVFEQPEN